MASTTRESDFEFVEELQDELMCSICMKVLNEPQMVNCCEQKFCKICLTKWIQRNNSCPFCRNTDFSYMLSKRQDRRISAVLVYCSNKENGCKSTLKISDYNHHLSIDNAQGCLFTKLPCPNECNSEIFRGELDAHCRDSCPRRTVQCSYCTSEGEHLFIVGIHLEKCHLYPIPCPRKCGDSIIREDLTAHQYICPLEPMACIFSSIGCNAQVSRQDLEKHIQSSMLEHMKAIAKSHTAIKSEHEALMEEHQSLKTDHESLRAEYAAMTGEHSVIMESNKSFEAKFRAIGVLIKGLSSYIPSGNKNEKKLSAIVSQLHTLLMDTSTLEMGNTLSLGISDSNAEFGHHYIILNPPHYKFKLEWRTLPQKVQMHYASDQQFPYQFRLYSVTDKDFLILPNTWNCDILLGIGSSYIRTERAITVTVCCGRSQNMQGEEASSYDQEDESSLKLLGMLTLNVPRKKAMLIQFQKHESSHGHHHHNTQCLCKCHSLSRSLES